MKSIDLSTANEEELINYIENGHLLGDWHVICHRKDLSEKFILRYFNYIEWEKLYQVSPEKVKLYNLIKYRQIESNVKSSHILLSIQFMMEFYKEYQPELRSNIF